MRYGFLFFALWMGLMSGCVIGGESKPSYASTLRTPEIDRAFEGAERFFYARRFGEAESAYQDFISRFPANALTSKAWFRLGEIAFHDKDWGKAVAAYKKSLARGIQPQSGVEGATLRHAQGTARAPMITSEWGHMALYKQAAAYSKEGDEKKVFSTLDKFPVSGIDSKIALRAASLRVNTARKSENRLEEIKGYLEALNAYEAFGLSESAGDFNWIVSQKTAQDEIRRWVEEVGEVKEDTKKLKEWQKHFEGTTAGGYILWKLARLANEKGDYNDASLCVHQYLEGYSKFEYASAARTLLKELDKRGAREEIAEQPSSGGSGEGRATVGVVLPLSGKYAVYGQSALHGIECAAGIYSPCSSDLGINLVIRDSQGDPKTASRMVGELARSSEVRAIVGPMATVEVDMAAVAAESAGVPMIALSQKPHLPETGEYVFRNFLTISDQVATVIGYACGEKRWKKLAILYPSGPAGEEYRKAFEEEVAHCGGKVVASTSYAADGRDVSDEMAQLKSSVKGAKIQALFVPDTYRVISNVVTALKSNELEGIRLLGGAGWNHPELVSRGGEGIDGAVFVDGFFAKGGGFTTKDFVSSYNAAYGVDPTLLEAYAYDTLRLLGGTLRDDPAAERPDLQKSLARKKGFSGVTGTISFDDEGDARRRLTILTVEQGEIREVR